MLHSKQSDLIIQSILRCMILMIWNKLSSLHYIKLNPATLCGHCRRPKLWVCVLLLSPWRILCVWEASFPSSSACNSHPLAPLHHQGFRLHKAHFVTGKQDGACSWDASQRRSPLVAPARAREMRGNGLTHQVGRGECPKVWWDRQVSNTAGAVTCSEL